MSETLQYTTAIILGLLGGGHCIGMCGGIVSALTLSVPADSAPATSSVPCLLTYNAGRIFSYTIAGFLMGMLGWFLGGFSRETQSGYSLVGRVHVDCHGVVSFRMVAWPHQT